MGKYYHNAVRVNNGLVLDGQTPIDDRFVFQSVRDLFINPESPQLCELYTNAYRGLIVACFGDADGTLYEDRVFALTLVNDAPYTKGSVTEINATNYKNYWKSIGGSFDGTDDLREADKVVGYFGDATGMTVEDFKDMKIDEILSKILFEYCAPVKVSDPALSIKYKTTKYNSAVEVGTALPKSTDMTPTFTYDVWRWQSKYASQYSQAVKGKELILCRSGEITYYLRKNSSDIELDSLTTTVVEGSSANGVVVAKQLYTSDGNAKDSRDSEINPATGTYYHQGLSGTAESGTLAIKGAWKPYANTKSFYTNATTAWNDKGKSVSGYTETGHNVLNTLFDAASEIFYVRFPADPAGTLPFYVWCPNSYTIQSVKAPNELSAGVFDQDWTYDDAGTDEFTNDLGVTGTFKKYKITNPDGGGLLSVAVTFTTSIW